jgi:hypothetical protein
MKITFLIENVYFLLLSSLVAQGSAAIMNDTVTIRTRKFMTNHTSEEANSHR